MSSDPPACTMTGYQGQQEKAVAVPSEAVHWDGSCHVVFVRDKRFFDQDAYKVFHTRTVRPRCDPR